MNRYKVYVKVVVSQFVVTRDVFFFLTFFWYCEENGEWRCFTGSKTFSTTSPFFYRGLYASLQKAGTSLKVIKQPAILLKAFQ